MQQATQLPATHQLPPTGPCFPVSPQGPGLLAELGIPPLQPQPAPSQSKAHTLPVAAPNQPEPLRVPHLRAVVESQAFKNILVDEMDLMLARAATLIQASWRGYLLRQKLVSQMSAAKAIQEAWRRFHTRRLLHSSRAALRRAPGPEADADIPYHAPQQVRFQSPGAECLACPPLMVSRETQCPSWDCLATCVPRPAPPPSPAAAPGAGRACRATFPQPATPAGLPGPCGLEPKFQSGLLTKTARNTSVVRQTGTEVVKTKPAAARTARAPESPPCGRGAQARPRGLRVPTQTPADAEDPRPQPHPCPAPPSAKTFLRPCTGLSTLRPPAQGGTAPTSRTLPQKCATSAPAPPQTCHEPATPRPPAHTHLLVSLTSTSTQTRAPSALLRPSVPVCLLSSTKTPAQPRPAAAGTKAPASPCPGAPGRTAPQVRPAVAPSRSPAVGPSKSSSQTGPRPPPQARLAAMLTRTPAHIRNVATVLKTLCLVHPSTGTLKAPACALQSSGAPKPKGAVSLKPGAGPARLPSQSCLPDAKARAGPHPQEDLGAPRAPAKASLDIEKTKISAPRLAKPEMVSKSSMTLAMSTVASWSRVAEAKPKPGVQTQQTEIIRVRSRLLVPADSSVAPPLTKATAHTQTPTGQSRATLQPRPATAPPLPGPYPTKTARQAKALCQAQLTSCLSRPHRPAELTVVLPTTCPPPGQPQLATCFTRTAAHFCPPATQTQVLSQATRLIKVSSQLYSSTEPHRAPSSPAKLAKAPSLAHLVTCLTRVQSHTHRPAGLGGDMAGCIYTARPPSTYLSSKAQSQPLLVASRPSTLPSQDPGPPGAVSGSPSDGRAAPIPPRCLTPGPRPRPAVSEAASTLVPLLAAASCTCRGDAWGDGRESASRPRAPAGSRPEDTAAAQIAALCAELASALGSQEDLRGLLARALSQGEVRAALNQALGTTVARALPHGVLSTALTRALSWGELGVTLTRVLSRGELRTELARAVQGRLADVLGKALSDEELLVLGQALCPGEPGILQGPAGTQVTRRPTAALPKAPSKPARSRMTVLSAPGALDCRVDPPPSWGVAVSSGRLPSCKGPVDAGAAGGPAWNPAAAVVTSRPVDHPVALGARRWAAAGSVAAVEPRQPGALLVSVHAMEKMVVQAAVTIQACARGYLVRRAIKVWHQWATVIQAAWRGHRVRRNLAQLYQATTVIQAAWRGYRSRRERARPRPLPVLWAEPGPVRLLRPRGRLGACRPPSEHRCFLSCQPDVCGLCRALSPGLPATPSVVMLVGSSPRTCHMCGHTLATRVVQGVGRGVPGPETEPWAWAAPAGLRLRSQDRAATAIQSAWRGFRTRCLLRRQQLAAKVLQSTWRGHYTRSCLTTDALLGPPGPWEAPGRPPPHAARWPGV
ncbi:IQ domain-containing protein N [Dipodomys merriami]|uniref:IQ domain-containing protein N n=1 Tax=Dipodomys merriami TaxID=94247 RepID=UPI003855E289